MDKLKQLTKLVKKDSQVLRDEREVIGRYSKVFAPERIKYLTREEFESFLDFKNNRHWSGIHRQKSLITKDFEKLKKALSLLLDESKPLEQRLDFLFPSTRPNYIKGLGRAVVTPILMVVYPDKYGVWNTKSESALKELGLYPEFTRKDSFATKYSKVNKVLTELKGRYDVTFWQLDWVLGMISEGEAEEEIETLEDALAEKAKEEGIEDIFNFGMEKHLEDFLVENWEKTKFGKDYELIYEEGDLKSQQYQTDVGPIDILARHKRTGDYLVVELKKGRGSDAVVGQIARYISWVEQNLAKDKGRVKGVIITREKDPKIELALKQLNSVSYFVYKVKFRVEKLI